MDKQKTIFLDRDGTMIEEVNFLSRVEDLRLFSFTKEAVKLLKSSGFRLIVLTNQSGIGRGIYDVEAMHAIHREMQVALDNAIDGFYFCPHLPDAGCECRKPKLQMIRDADQHFGVDFENSWMIGDKILDVETGGAAGIRTALVKTGYGAEHEKLLRRKPEIIAEDLFHAAQQIVSLKK
jgi:D-glycero-D-manno-heptose 1,7-bisphosphate phosphatase